MASCERGYQSGAIGKEEDEKGGREVPGFVGLAHGGERVEEAGAGVVLTLDDPRDDGLRAGEQRLLVLLRREGASSGCSRRRCHWGVGWGGRGWVRVRVPCGMEAP